MAVLTGRVVLVTGAGRGLGRAHALELARHGATVVANDLGVTLTGVRDRNAAARAQMRGDDAHEIGDSSTAISRRTADPQPGPSPAESVVAEIAATGGSAMADHTSVSDRSGIEALVQRITERCGRLDAVVNNAGFLRDKMLTSMSEDDFDRVLEVHVKGTFVVSRHACAHWRALAKAGERVSGRIVNTTSGAGLWGNVGQTNYAAAKSAIVGMTTVIALEMERYGVTANAISPIAATRMTQSAGMVDDHNPSSWDPMDPANASPVVAWLVSEESGWLSGAILRIDGDAVSRVDGPQVSRTFHGAPGRAVNAEELGTALRSLYGTFPAGLLTRQSFD